MNGASAPGDGGGRNSDEPRRKARAKRNFFRFQELGRKRVRQRGGRPAKPAVPRQKLPGRFPHWGSA
jgi:hypothetical protein